MAKMTLNQEVEVLIGLLNQNEFDEVCHTLSILPQPKALILLAKFLGRISDSDQYLIMLKLESAYREFHQNSILQT